MSKHPLDLIRSKVTRATFQTVPGPFQSVRFTKCIKIPILNALVMNSSRSLEGKTHAHTKPQSLSNKMIKMQEQTRKTSENIRNKSQVIPLVAFCNVLKVAYRDGLFESPRQDRRHRCGGLTVPAGVLRAQVDWLSLFFWWMSCVHCIIQLDLKIWNLNWKVNVIYDNICQYCVAY